MKDGFAQQQNEIVRILKEVFPSAVEGAYGWDIGEQIDLYLHFYNDIKILTGEVS